MCDLSGTGCGIAMSSESIKDNDPAATITHRINTYISGSPEARRSIKAVYLYGSVLHKERFRHNSDIDLAFLLDRSLYHEDPLIYSGPAYMAATEVSMMLNRKTDVIILNSASIETAYCAITTGTPIYDANQDDRVEYEAYLKGLYFDFRPFLEALRNRSCMCHNQQGKACQ
jgi:predicted nucleotidyltransferase